jgi:hypothetical protein
MSSAMNFHMPTELVFQTHLVLGYVAWLLVFAVYIWPRLRTMDRIAAQRAIATLHSFRFFGLAFLVPGVVSPALPPTFAAFVAYGDFATGVLALLALMTVKIRPLFWLFVTAFNIVGFADLISAYYHAIQLNVPANAGEMGAVYWVPVLYVPILMITHLTAFYLVLRGRGQVKVSQRVVAH